MDLKQMRKIVRKIAENSQRIWVEETPQMHGYLDSSISRADFLCLVEIAEAAESIADANPNDRWWDTCCGKRVCAVIPELMDRLLEAVFGSPSDVAPKPDSCPKCGGAFRNPEYKRSYCRGLLDCNFDQGDHLRYVCGICGYSDCRPCRDAKEAPDELRT